MSRPRKKDTRGTKGDGSIYSVERTRKDGSLRTMWVAALSYRDSDGRQQRVVSYAASEKAALEKLKEIRDRPEVRAKLPKSKGSLGQFIDTWLETDVKTNLRSSTAATYSATYRKHIEPHALAKKPLAKIDSADIDALYRKLVKDGVQPRTRRKVHDLLASVFRRAMERKAIAVDPLFGIPRPSYDAPAVKALSRAQINAFLKAAEGDPLEALYVTTIFTGLRSGEILALTWGDVDLKAGVLTVRSSLRDTGLTGKGTPKRVVGDPKTEGSARPVVLPKLAIDALKRHHKLHAKASSSDLVFPNDRGGPIWRQNLLRRSFYPLLHRAGLYHDDKPLITFHGLRHVHGTELFRQGVHPKIVQERLGHSRIGITLDTYSSSVPSLQKAAVDSLNRSFAPKRKPRRRAT